MEKSRKPKIRFKGFTADWEQRELGELILEYKKTVDSSCTLPVLTSSKTEGVILQEEHFGRKQQHDITGYNVLPRSFCTYRNRSDGVDFTFNVNECCDMGIISKFYPVFCGNDNDTFFLSLVLNNSDEVVHEIAFTCIGTGQKVLSFLDLQKMSIRVPKQSEQKKISTYFKQLDDLITLHQRKLDKLINVKKSMLEKMFPKQGSTVPEIRFNGFTQAWEQRELKDMCTIITKQTGFDYSATIKPSLITTKEDDTYPFIQNKDFEGMNINLDTDFYIPISVAEKYPKITLDQPSLLISISGRIGNIGLYSLDSKAFIGGAVGICKLKNIEDGKTTLYELLSPIGQKYFNSLIKASSHANITVEDIRNIEVLLPKHDEEKKKIDIYFDNLDNLITLHQRKLEKLKNIKKSMLEKMFI